MCARCHDPLTVGREVVSYQGGQIVTHRGCRARVRRSRAGFVLDHPPGWSHALAVLEVSEGTLRSRQTSGSRFITSLAATWLISIRSATCREDAVKVREPA